MTNLNTTINKNLNVNLNTTAPAPINKLEEKLSDWIEKVEASHPDYCAITVANGKMYYLSEKNSAELLSVDMLTDSGNGMERTFSYRKEDNPSNTPITPFSAIIKKEDKLIVNHNGHLFGFGFKDSSESKIKLMIIHFRTACTHTIITASNTSDSIEVFHAWNSRPNDPIKLCLNALFDSVAKRKEVTAYGEGI